MSKAGLSTAEIVGALQARYDSSFKRFGAKVNKIGQNVNPSFQQTTKDIPTIANGLDISQAVSGYDSEEAYLESVNSSKAAKHRK